MSKAERGATSRQKKGVPRDAWTRPHPLGARAAPDCSDRRRARDAGWHRTGVRAGRLGTRRRGPSSSDAYSAGGSDRQPASTLPLVSWPQPAPTARTGAQPRVEWTVSGRAPTDGRVRPTPALSSGPVCENTPRPTAGVAEVATTQRGDEFGQEATGRAGNDGTGNLGVGRRALPRSLEPAGGAQCCPETPEAIGPQAEEKSCEFFCKRPDASRSESIHVTARHNGKAGHADIQRPFAADDARGQRASGGRRPVSH